MNRCMTLASTILALLTLGARACPALADEKERLLGAWKLVSAVSEDLATSQKTNIYKGAPVGFITYSTDGRIMVIVVDSDRKKPAGAVATAPEAEALFRSMAAYAGTYTIKGGQVIHLDVSWNETWTGTDQIRNYKFDAGRLASRRRPHLIHLLAK